MERRFRFDDLDPLDLVLVIAQGELSFGTVSLAVCSNEYPEPLNTLKAGKPIGSISRAQIFLWSLIVFGMLLRVLNIIVLSPLDASWTNSEDAVRHVRDAISLDHLSPLGKLDLPLYQIWLHQFVSDSRQSVCVQIILSLVTPTVWWLWMRRCLPTRMLALIGFAALTLLPSWIAIFSFFMPETILLPLTGLALFLSAEASRRRSLPLYCLSALIWGLGSTIKLTIFSCYLILLILQFRQSLRSGQWKRGLTVALLQIGICALCYASIPLRNFAAFHAWTITPAVLPYSEAYYLSGRQTLKADFRFEDREGKLERAVIFIRSPCVLSNIKVLEPFSDWQTSRAGDYAVEVDYRKNPNPIYPHCDLLSRIKLTWENWLFFYFSDSSPDDVGSNIICALQHSMRWLWLPLSVLVFAGSLYLRRGSTPVALAAITTAMFLSQQSWILEGRYRKPLEGLLIVSLLSLVSHARVYLRKRTSLEH